MWFVFNFGHFGCGKKDKLITTFKLAFGNNKIDRLPQRSKCIWFIECKFLVRPFSRQVVGNASLHRRTDLSQVTSTPADADHHWYHLQCLFICVRVSRQSYILERTYPEYGNMCQRFVLASDELNMNHLTIRIQNFQQKLFLPITLVWWREGVQGFF